MAMKAFRLALASATMLAGGAIAVTPVHAQVGQASLRGTIGAPADNPVEGVTAVDVASGFRTNAALAANGAYNFASLRPGTYRLEIRLRNGSRNSDEFTLRTGQNAGLDIDLTTAVAPTPTREEETGATPTSAPPEVDGDVVVVGNRIRSLAGGQVGINITQRLIEQLPQNNRNFLAFADLAPGVRFIEEGADGQARIQGGAQRSNSVNVFIDGVSQKDYVLKNGVTGQDSSQGNPFPQLAIGEYQVLSSNYKAEFDQVSSVAITATTKSGTNEFHGEGFFDYTDQSLRALRPTELQTGKVDTEDKQFGVALGGPIIRDVMHFFASYEGKRQERPVDVLPNQGVDINLLPPDLRSRFGTFSNSFREDLYFGKLSIQPTSADLIEFTGKYRDEGGNQLGTGIATFSTRTIAEVEELRALGRWQHTADTWINDFRVSYEDVRFSPRPAEEDINQLFQRTELRPIGINRFDLIRIGGGQNFQDKGQKGWTVQNDFTFTGVAGHTFKVGAKAKWVRLNTLEQNNINGQYTYDVNLFSQTGFQTDIPYELRFGAPSGFSNPVVRSNNFQFGIYAQDDWDVNDQLTLNLGLRWDFERTPAYLNFVTPQVNLDAVSAANYPNLVNADYDINDYIATGNNRKPFLGAFQPRLGFTYRFDEAGRFSTFGGYGRSYDRNQFDFLQQELTVGSFQQRTFLFQGANQVQQCVPSPTCIPWDPIYLTAEGRARLATGSVGGGRELRFINNDLKVPYSDQFSLGLRGRFSPAELEIGYTRIQSRDGFVYLLGNRRPDGTFFNPQTTAQQTPQSPFPFTPPGFGSILIGDTGLETNADSVYVKFTKAYSAASPWSIDATYTFTEAEENRQFGETFSLDFPSINDYPVLRSVSVPRHRFVTAGSVDLPIGVSVGAKFQIESPLYQVAPLETSTPFRRTFVGAFRESLGDQWGRRQLDLSATKYLPIRFINDDARIRIRVDIINLMNDRNYIEFNNNPLDNSRTDDTPTIYRERTTLATGGNPPRTIKLSAGFTF